MKAAVKEAYIFEVDENGNIGEDFASITEGQVPPWSEFDEWVESRRSERAQMYEKEYVSWIGERPCSFELRVSNPDE